MRLYQEIGHVLPACAAVAVPAARTAEEAAAQIREVTATLMADEPRYRALVALAPDTAAPVGVLTMCESCAPYAGGYFGIIQEFYIVPEMRSRGVGRAMIGFAREIALQKKWSRLEVTAPLDPAFTRSVAFYRAFGFKDSGPRLFLPTVPR